MSTWEAMFSVSGLQRFWGITGCESMGSDVQATAAQDDLVHDFYFPRLCSEVIKKAER